MTSYSWAGGNGDWNSTNWSPLGTPTSSTSATISASGTYTVTVDSSDSASALTLSDSGADLVIGASGTLSVGGAFNMSAGALNINSGGTLTLAGALDITGGAFTLASGGLISGGAIDATGGTISWTGGTLSGVTVWGPLNLTAISASVQLENGAAVVGSNGSGAGVINATGSGASLYLDTAQTLSNETINLGYSAGSLNYLQLVTGGASYGLAASTTLNILGRSEINDQAASTTFTNSGAIVVSGGVLEITGFGLWNYDDYFTNAGSLTINSGGGLLTEISNFTNSGTITVNTGVTATLDPTTFATTSTSVINVAAGATLKMNVHNNWNNLGSISLASGSTLLLEDDTITAASLGTVSNSGGVIEIGPGATYSNAGATLTATSGPGVLTLDGGTISGGTVASGELAFSAAGGTLSGVTVDGPITLGASQVLSLASGDQFLGGSGTGAGVVNVTGAAAYLDLGSDVSLSDETINVGNSADSLAYVELNVAGSAYALGASATLDVLGSANLDYDKVPGSFTNNGAIDVSSGGLAIVGYSNYGYTDNFTNAGTITLSADTSLYSFSLTSLVNSGSIVAGSDDQITLAATTLTDNGSISVGANSTLTLDPTNLTVGASGSISVGANSDAYIEPSNTWTNLASNTLTGGSYSVGDDGLFEVYSFQTLTALAASVTLNGSGSQFELYNSTTNVSTALDSSLTTIAASGALSLLRGRGWTLASAGTNNGDITLGGGTIAGASLTNAAGSELVGYGAVEVNTFANSGTIEASDGTLQFEYGVTGAGTLEINAGANLILGGAVASGASVVFDGTSATLTLTAPSTFGATISGLAAGDKIDLSGVAANLATVSGSQLILTENGTTTATLNLTSAEAAIDTFTFTNFSGGTGLVAVPGPATATVAQYLGAISVYDQASSLTIEDTPGDIEANIASLNDPHITEIVSEAGGVSATPIFLASVAVANSATVDKIVGGYTVSDTAAHIQADLGLLTDTKIGSIVVSDNGPVAVMVSQLTSYASQIAKLRTSTGATYQINISDTAADIESGIATLQSDVSNLGAIASTTGAVIESAPTAVADLTALNKISGGFYVTDTAANIVSNLATLASDASITKLMASGTGTFSGISTLAVGTFDVTGSGAAVTIGANITETGAFGLGAGATLSISSGDTFTIDGAATFSGAVTGSGQLTTQVGTATFAVAPTVASWTSSNETITDSAALIYAGAFTAGAGDVMNLTAGTVVLTGATAISGGFTTEGTKSLTFKGATTVSGALNIYGTGGLCVSALTTVSGGNVTLGDSAGNAAPLSIVAGGTLDFTDNHSLLEGTSTSSLIKVSGLLEKTGGTGLTDIIPAIANNGAIVVTSGTLELSGALTGTGTQTISGGSILEVAGADGSGQSVSFSGTGALELLSPSTFSATVGALAIGDTIDLVGVTANGVKVSGSQLIVTENGATVATLNLSSAAAAEAFSTSAVSGGTDIALTPVTATIAQYLGAVSTYDQATGGIAISDTAAKIEANIGSLTDPHIVSIASTSGAVVVTAPTAAANLTVLNKISGGFYVTDTAANIVNNLATLASDASITKLIASGTGTFGGISTLAVGTFDVTGSGAAVTIGANITETGAFGLGAGATLSISSGDTFTIDGAATFSGTVAGSGQLTTQGGSATFAVAPTVSSWTSSNETIADSAALTYAGKFTAGAGDVMNLTAGTVVLAGATTVAGGFTTEGTKSLTFKAATTVSGVLNIYGTGGLCVSALTTVSGGNVTLGDSVGDAAPLSIVAGGTLDFTDNHSLLEGTSTSSLVKVSGYLEKTGGTGLTDIIPAIANNGAIVVTSGTLELAGAVTGTGTQTISGATILEVAGADGSGQTVSFSGTSGALELLSPSTFSAGISGFDMGGASGDSLILGSSWAMSGFSENSAGTSGTMTLSNGSATTTLSLAGNYNGSLFAHSTNASGQSVITYT